MALKNDVELIVNFNSDVLDKSGNGRDGTVDGMTYDTSTPILGSGTGKFDGINDRVDIDVAASPQSDILDLTTGQIAFWFRNPGPASENKFLFSITKDGVAPSSQDAYAVYVNTSNALIVYCRLSGSIIMSASTPTGSLEDTDVKHLIIVKANPTGNIIIKIDNVTQTLTSSPLGAKFLGHAVDADVMTLGALKRDTIVYSGTKHLDALVVWSAVKSDAEDTEYWNDGDGVELDVSAMVTYSNLLLTGVS
jgi:hypothetical protein